jgi:uncharacterized membrane protein (DUF485 family)
MRPVRLARIAAEAELLRLRRIAVRLGIRAAYGAVALVFLIMFLAFVHVTGFLALELVVAPVYAALIIMGVDLLIAVVFGALAARSSEDRIEREAREVRETAVQQLGRSLSLLALFTPMTRQLRKRGFLSRTIANVADGVLRR